METTPQTSITTVSTSDGARLTREAFIAALRAQQERAIAAVQFKYGTSSA